VANLIKGKPVSYALDTLAHISKKAGDPLYALLASAVSNAKNNFNMEKENLIVKDIRVDGGLILKRNMPRARGMAYRINKRTSHVNITLAPKVEKEIKAKKPSAEVKKETVKVKKEQK
jgi:large subunit ribosomal protein L22